MGWLAKEKKPRNTSALYAALKSGTMTEFLEVYDPSYVDLDFSGVSLLALSMGNDTAIAHRLLDDGADVNRSHPLHTLLGRDDHDFVAEPLLLQRMLDLGSDVNAVLSGFGTPLEAIGSRFKFSDATLTPFYDVILARPELDLLQPGLDDRPVLVNLRLWAVKRALLVERAEAVLNQRGTPLP